MPDATEIGLLLDEYASELQRTDAWLRDPAAAREAVLAGWRQNFAVDGQFTLYRAKGCPACNDTGYKGRVGLHELMVGSDPVKKLIRKRHGWRKFLPAH